MKLPLLKKALALVGELVGELGMESAKEKERGGRQTLVASQVRAALWA